MDFLERKERYSVAETFSACFAVIAEKAVHCRCASTPFGFLPVWIYRQASFLQMVD
jgi:hypothetical protein